MPEQIEEEVNTIEGEIVSLEQWERKKRSERAAHNTKRRKPPNGDDKWAACERKKRHESSTFSAWNKREVRKVSRVAKKKKDS